MKQRNLRKGFVVFLTIMITLFCGVMPGSGAQDSNVSDCDDCKNRNFEGCYGFSHTGDYIITVPEDLPTVSLPSPTFIDLQVTMVSNGVYHLDGNEGLTGEETVRLVFPSPSPLSYPYPPSFFTAQIIGTYEVSENCSGTASVCVTPDYLLPDPGGPGFQSEISFVIVGKGEEIIMTTVKMNTPCGGPLLLDEMGNVVPIKIVGPVKKQSCDDVD